MLAKTGGQVDARRVAISSIETASCTHDEKRWNTSSCAQCLESGFSIRRAKQEMGRRYYVYSNETGLALSRGHSRFVFTHGGRVVDVRLL